MNLNFKNLIVVLSSAALLLTGCATSKQIVYLQDIDVVELQKLAASYEPKIKKDDLLSIVVSGPDKQVIQPYNLTLSETMTTASQDPSRVTLPYLVDKNGEIDFPVFGKIKVEGMTRSELSDYLSARIARDVKEPVVYVSFQNFKITVLGEVRNPGTYTFDSEKCTIFQALGRAGDLALTAKREDILLIREVDGTPTYQRIDLKSAETINSDAYFLQQNDVLYIPPSASRVASATTATGIWSTVLSSVTTVVSVVSLVLALSK